MTREDDGAREDDKRVGDTTGERELLAMRLASAVDYLITVARNSGLPGIVARLEDVQQDLVPLTQRAKRIKKSAKNDKRASDEGL